MAQADLLKKLFRSFTARDDPGFYAAAQEVIEEERQKNHHLLVRDLERILYNGRAPKTAVVSGRLPNDVPTDKERGLPLLQIQYFDYGWERIVLPDETRETLQAVILEFRKREVLAAYGLQPKGKLLFYGPPGCGKTLCARVLASVLGLPLLYVRFDGLVSSYLGETAANLRRVFDYAQRGQWVLLFDEFDAIGKGRDNPLDHGELKRVVNSLLQLIDNFTGESLLIAATNHERLLDPALWRRFDEIFFFGVPDGPQRQAILQHYLAGFRHTGIDLDKLAARLEGMTGGDLERLCLDAIKRAILSGRQYLEAEDLDWAFGGSGSGCIWRSREVKEWTVR